MVDVTVPVEELDRGAPRGCVAFGTSPAALVHFSEPHVNVVVVAGAWDMESVASLRQQRPSFSEVVALDGARDVLQQHIPNSPELLEFIVQWSDVLTELSGCARVGVRLATATQAMCPRFHVDLVTVRFVCTLAGAGTEFLDNSDCDRRYLAGATGGALEPPGLLRPAARVQSAPPGAMACLKGELWPGNRGNGAVHRSPRVSIDAPRLVVDSGRVGVAPGPTPQRFMRQPQSKAETDRGESSNVWGRVSSLRR